MDKKQVLKAVGVGLAGLMIGGLGVGMITPDKVNPINGELALEIIDLQEQLDVKPLVVTEVETVVETVEVEVPVEVDVCTPDLDFITQALEDREVFEDAATVVEEIKAEDEAIEIAKTFIEDNFADELEDEGLVDDERDAELRTIYDDYEDIEVVTSDYDDDEYRFIIRAKIYDDDVEDSFKAFFEVEVEDGDAKIRDVRLDD